MGTRSKHIETYIQDEKAHKHLIFVLNKCDLVPTWVTRRWAAILSADHPTLAFHASLTNSFGKGALIALLRQFSKLHLDKKQISVGFIGYPNVGKSSIINALRAKKVSLAPLRVFFFFFFSSLFSLESVLLRSWESEGNLFMVICLICRGFLFSFFFFKV